MALTEKIRDICKREVKIPYFAFARDYFEKRKLEEIKENIIASEMRQREQYEQIRDKIIDARIRQREQRFDRIISELYS